MMIDEIAQEIANDISTNSKDDKVKKFPILIILQILGPLLTWLLQRWLSKNKNAQAIKQECYHMNLINRALIGISSKRFMRDHSDHYDVYNENKHEILKHVFNKIGSLEPLKIEQAILEAPKVKSEYLTF